MLAKQSPSSFVAFDVLAADGHDLRQSTQAERRRILEKLLARAKPPLYLTPVSRDRSVAREWLDQFEGAGLDGVIAKPEDSVYQPGKRTMLKVKHVRSADCVVAGFRWYKNSGPRDAKPAVGSLLLGLYDDSGVLHHVGVTSSFTMAKRHELAAELEPLRKDAMKNHPWREWASAEEESPGGAPSGDRVQRMPGASSRWSAGKDLSWEPLRVERVAEVKYDHLQGDRFRHAAIFLRWRPDKRPKDCRYDQLEVTTPFELAKVFGSTAATERRPSRRARAA
jgi:ATP-dependent DNA ligase